MSRIVYGVKVIPASPADIELRSRIREMSEDNYVPPTPSSMYLNILLCTLSGGLLGVVFAALLSP